MWGIYNYFLFFVTVAFVVSCSMVLFVSTLSDTLNIKLTEDNLGAAAKLTFINVVFLSILFTIIDFLRRKFTTQRVTNYIADGVKKVAEGDFSVRIANISKFGIDEKYNEIIDSFNMMTEELEGVETLRTDFIASVSHEMKTPLAVIKNYAYLLQKSQLTEELKVEYTDGILDGIKKMSDMMTNILKLNKLEKQQIYPKTEEYDLGEQLCECLINYEAIWEKKNIEISTDIGSDIRISTDKELLDIVWNNLFSNAFKFTPDNGKVSVTLEKKENYICVKVSDTGCGISKEIGERIFEKFYQGDTSHKTEGNGLGLALVKRVIDILHGDIEVESRNGEGSKFIVKFSSETI